MNRPVILRPVAQADIQCIHADLECIRSGLGGKFISSLRIILERIEMNPEVYGVMWRDVRAVRLKNYRYVVYYVAFAERVEVLGVLHGARDPAVWKGRL